MILDWYNNSKQILQTHRLTDNDNAKIIQEVCFLRYLITLDYTKEQVHQAWLSIENGTAKSFEYDPEEQNVFFNTQYQSAVRAGKLTDNEYNCNIYQEEIDWLNGLAAPLWFRKYLFGLYIFYKSKKQKYSYVEFKVKKCSCILSKCDPNLKYKRKSEAINQWNRDCGLPMKLYPYNHKVFLRFKEIAVKNENIVCQNISVENFPEYFYLLEEKTFVCPRCGEKMEIQNGNCKRVICNSCYQKDLKKRNLLCKHKEKVE